MTTYYTTAAKVASLMRLTDSSGARLTFGVGTDPTLTEVETIISYKEDVIDKYTNNSWRPRTVLLRNYSIPIPYSHINPNYTVINLRQRNIISIDKLYWNNADGTQSDWVTTRTQGIGKDWYFDRETGFLYMRRPYTLVYEKNTLTISFTYGEGVTATTDPQTLITTYTLDVPHDIEEACTKLVACHFMENDFDRSALVDGPMVGPSRESVISHWKNEAENIMRRRMNYVLVGTL